MACSLRIKHLQLFASAAALTVVTASAQGEFTPPADAVVDVTDFGAIPDDGIDDTAAINAAFDASGRNRVVYIPDGVYDVSDTIKFAASAPNQRRKYFIGQSRDGTVLRLGDNASGYTDPNNPKPVVQPYFGTGAADAFRNSMYNMTIDTGVGNAGAIGAAWVNHNTGGIRNVRIKSSDPAGAGVQGVLLSPLLPGVSGDPGPGLMKDVVIEGFDQGVRLGATEFGYTFENLTVRNQNDAGLSIGPNLASIRGLRSENNPTAVVAGSGFNFTLIDDSEIAGPAGGTSGPAIRAEAALGNPGLFVRNVSTSNHALAIGGSGVDSPVAGPAVASFTSRPVFNKSGVGPDRSLGLTVRETPEVSYPAALSDWVSVSDFGAVANDGVDDASAVQQAIDFANANGKSTIYFPNQTGGGDVYDFGSQVQVTGGIERIIGFGARMSTTPSSAVRAGTQRVWNFQHTSDTIVFEQFGLSDPGDARWYGHNSSQDLVIRNTIGGGYLNLMGAGVGDVFIEDVTGNRWAFSDGQRVWARQLNAEGEPDANDLSVPKILNDGADLWVFGLKTEDASTVIETRDGGRTELLGGFIFPTGPLDGDTPVFLVDNAEATFSYLMQDFSLGQNAPILQIREIVGEEMFDILTAETFPRPGEGGVGGNGLFVPLAVARGSIPEPGTAAALVLMGGALGGRRPRRRALPRHS